MASTRTGCSSGEFVRSARESLSASQCMHYWCCLHFLQWIYQVVWTNSLLWTPKISVLDEMMQLVSPRLVITTINTTKYEKCAKSSLIWICNRLQSYVLKWNFHNGKCKAWKWQHYHFRWELKHQWYRIHSNVD